LRRKLPDELVSEILAWVIQNHTRGDVLHLREANDLQNFAAEVLSTQIAETAPFRPLLEQTVLETCPIRLDITFDRSGTSLGYDVVAHHATFVLDVLPHVRTLVLRFDSYSFLPNDHTLEKAAAGMAHLACQFSRYALQEFIVEITVRGPANPAASISGGGTLIGLLLGYPCHNGQKRSQKRSRAECENLVEAMQNFKVAKEQYLKLDIHFPWKTYDFVGLQVTKTAVEDTQSAVEIVEDAVQKISNS
jgi:hypothetical protein